ncbi:hypothetical protein BSKO_10262 [Bryopsis sp. KO-2023]|nr:hypothetical protein BSKO_10262 [Bryopsis sp. KO-2023]
MPKKIDKKKKKNEKEEEAPQDEAPPPPPPMPGEDFALPTREIVKPDNQLGLTEAELEEEIPKMLTANNPSAPKNVARFNMKERCFKFDPMVEQTMVHYSTDGWLLHKSSDEAKKQMDLEKMQDEALSKFQAELDKASERKDEGTDMEPPDDSRQLRNQFNFSERAAQTFNNPIRERSTFTEPPPTAAMSGSCSQWEIYDEYIRDLERQKIQEEINKQKAAAKKGGGAPPPAPAVSKDDSEDENRNKGNVLHGKDMGKAAKVVERMVNQNTFDEISMDFKYWDDTSDAYREGEGTLLPLWKFSNDLAKRKHVTAICWNPTHLDMFAVGYGSYDFLKPTSGLICIYSLKNPSYPEYVFTTDSGVLSLDFHPQLTNLLAVGCYDGTVLVYNTQGKLNKPIYESSIQTGKHNDPVWQVLWQPNEAGKQLEFCSVSTDGSVGLWTLTKSEMVYEEAMRLRLVQKTGETEMADTTAVGSMAGGCCLDFNKSQDFMYLVGTEEGLIHRCSKAYSSEYLNTYEGHSMAVYSVRWNYIHTRMFLSASADWTAKLWDSASPDKPIMTFDLNSPVGDVAWAPYSSTVFAAVTDEGKVHVYDLAQNKHEAMCEQLIVRKAKLTKLVFNPKFPILLVGDDRGCVTSLKLSPNLRKVCQPEKGEKLEELEVAKLDKVIEVALKSYVGEEES